MVSKASKHRRDVAEAGLDERSHEAPDHVRRKPSPEISKTSGASAREEARAAVTFARSCARPRRSLKRGEVVGADERVAPRKHVDVRGGHVPCVEPEERRTVAPFQIRYS